MYEKKHIIHIINGLELGGAETALYQLLKKSVHEFNISIIVLQNNGILSEKIRDLNIPIHYLHLQKKHIFKSLHLLRKIIRNEKPDIIQTWLYHSDLIGGIIGKICGVPKILWSIRCEGIHLKNSTSMIQKFCAKLSNYIPHAIICNSQAAKNSHILKGYAGEKIKVIHNGIDTHQYQQKISQNSNAFITIGTLGRNHADKNYHQFIQAIDLICERFSNVQFKICGPGCEDLSPLIQKIKHHDKVEIINGTNAVFEYLSNLDVFILPSRTESFPNALAEAMLCGIPCIASSVGDIPILLNKYGILIDSPTSDKIAEACINMLRIDDNSRKKLGSEGANWVKQQFSLEHYYQQMKTLY